MRNTLTKFGWLFAGILAGVVTPQFFAPPAADASRQKAVSEPVPTLQQLAAGELPIVDLTWTLNDRNPYWPGENYEPFRLKTIATLGKDGVLSKSIFTPEHLGTHLDAPNHFEKNQPSVDEITPEAFFGPGVVIDVAAESEADPDFLLSIQHIEQWERTNEQVPTGAIVFLKTGWGRHWTNYPRYKNQDAMGKMHFPGYSVEAVRFLIEKRKIRGIGIDTLSIDRGLSREFAVHHALNAAGRYGLENVARLEELPASGFHVFVAPVKVEAGTGGPTRIFAILPPKP
ncbi:MAG: cyclase family protein [Planctomycetota bacterium]|nr:cyclase family protein [Planctomycetota bacterium]